MSLFWFGIGVVVGVVVIVALLVWMVLREGLW